MVELYSGKRVTSSGTLPVNYFRDSTKISLITEREEHSSIFFNLLYNIWPKKFTHFPCFPEKYRRYFDINAVQRCRSEKKCCRRWGRNDARALLYFRCKMVANKNLIFKCAHDNTESLCIYFEIDAAETQNIVAVTTLTHCT